MSISGSEPQLTATNGLSARSLAECRARAKNSLPVPDSPTNNNGTSRDSSRLAAWMLRPMAGSPRSSSSSTLRLIDGAMRSSSRRQLLLARLQPLGLRRLRDREEAAAVAGLVDRQRVERLLLAAAQQGRQRDVEDALERRAHQLAGALAAELEEGVAIERGDGSRRHPGR